MKANAIPRIIVETYSRKTVLRSPCPFVGYCEACGMVATFVPASMIAVGSGFGLRRVFLLIEAGTIHCIEAEPAQVWVCEESVRRFLVQVQS